MQISRIMVPTDFSPASEAAFPHACALARLHGATLILTHVCARTDEILQARRHLQEIAVTMAPLVCEAAVSVGHADTRLAQMAVEYDAGIIVMSTRGISGWSRSFLGSTAEATVRHAPCPVLTVRGTSQPSSTPRAPLLQLRRSVGPNGGPTATARKRILVPVDFSEDMVQSLKVADDLARSNDAELLILHILEWTGYSMVMDQPVLPATLNDVIESTERHLGDVAAQHCHVAFTVLVGLGTPAPTTVRVAQQEEADLIVMGTHGRSGLTRLLMGSVAEAVVRMAPCPVLTIRIAAPMASAV